MSHDHRALLDVVRPALALALASLIGSAAMGCDGVDRAGKPSVRELTGEVGTARGAVLASPPGPRFDHASVWDSTADRMLTFAGFGNANNDVWSLDFGGAVASWSTVPIQSGAAKPVSRRGHSAVWDDGGNLMVVFGGSIGSTLLQETWVWGMSGGSSLWSQLTIAGASPGAREDHCAVWDPVQRQMIVFGGKISGAYANDAWVLDVGVSPPTWVAIEPEGPPPPPRSDHAAAWDPVGEQMIVFGGGSPVYLDDTWALRRTPSGWSWLQLDASSRPTPRVASSLVWDTSHGAALLFGGLTSGAQASAELWRLSVQAGEAQWTTVEASGPSKRQDHTAVWDPDSGTMVIFGGINGGLAKNDTWVATPGTQGAQWQQVGQACETSPVAPALSSPSNGTTVSGCGPTLTWSAPGGTSGITFDVVLNGAVVAQGLTGTSHSIPSHTVLSTAANSWQVRAVGCGGVTASSPVWYFNVPAQGAPSVPVLLTPANNSTGYCDATFDWSVTGAKTGDSYDLLLGALPPPLPAYAAGLTTTAYSPGLEQPLSSGLYLWQVRAKRCTGESATSAFRTFTVNNTPPTPALTAPAEGGWVGATPIFKWQVSNAEPDVRYSLYVDGAAVATGLSSTTYTPDFELAEGPHTWYVVATGCAGATASSGQPRALQVDFEAPGPFALSAPEDGAWTHGSEVAFAWQAAADSASGVESYTVYFDDEVVGSAAAPDTALVADLGSTVEQDYYYTFSSMADWSLGGGWGPECCSTFNSSTALSDSPGSNYGNNWNYSAVWSQPCIASATTSVSYARWYDLQSNYDFVSLEVKGGSGAWTNVVTYTGSSSWSSPTYSLSQYQGQSIQLRWRITTNSYTTKQGIWIDNMSISNCVISAATPEGVHEWRVEAQDVAGNTRQSMSAHQLGFDYTAPNVAATPIPITAASPYPSFTWSPASDTLSGIKSYEVVVGTEVVASAAGATLVAVPDEALDEGVYNWKVRAWDKAGNSKDGSSAKLYVDLTPPAPAVPLTPCDTFVGSLTPDLAFSAASDGVGGSGIAGYAVFVDGVEQITLGPASGTLTTSIFGFDGPHEWFVRTTDNAGWTSDSAICTFTTETTPPDPFSHVSPPSGSTLPTLKPTLCWQASADAGSGLDRYELSLSKPGQGTSTYIVEPDTLDVVCYQIDQPPLVNGSYTWLVTAYDVAGKETLANSGVAWSLTVDMDVTAPTSTISTPVSNALLGGASVSLSGSASDGAVGSGVDLVELCFDACTPGAWDVAVTVPQPGGVTWSYAWSAATDGAHTAYVRAVDKEGNVQSPPTTRAFLVDLGPPADFGLSLPLEGAFSAGCPSFSWQGTTDATAGMSHYELWIQPASGPPIVKDVGLVTQTSLGGESCLEEGTYTWFVKAYDALGNAKESASARTLRVDLTSPVAFPLLSQTIGLAGGWVCNNRSVTVSWSPSADAGPAGGAGLASQPYRVFLDGAQFGGATANVSRTFTGLSDGTHSWTVRACDKVGNCTDATASPQVGTFTVDCTPPALAEAASVQLYANHVPSRPGIHSGHPLATGLTVAAGEQIAFEVRGELCFSDNAACEPSLTNSGSCMGPDGIAVTPSNFTRFYPQLPFGRVVAIVGDHEDEPINIGSSNTVSMPYAGELYLATNDNDTLNCPDRWHAVSVRRIQGASLLFPSDGEASDEVQPLFEWTSIADAGIGVERIELRVNGDVVEGNLAPDATSFLLPASHALTEQVNSWQLRAYDLLGNVAVSSTRTIRTDLSPPAPFGLVSPAPGGIVLSKTPELCWSETTDAMTEVAHYLVYVDEEYNTAQVASAHCQGVKQPLSEGEHCFQVVARDVLQHEQTSSGSPRCFVVDTVPPADFELLGPAAGAVSHTARPEFCWETTGDDGTGVQTYEVWLSGNKLSVLPAPAELPPPSMMCWTPAGPLPNGDYQWFVRAVDGAGHPAQSDARSLSIDKDVLPPSVQITSPATGELFGMGAIELHLYADDPSPGTWVAAVSVYVNGDPNDEYVALPGESPGSWVATLPVDATGAPSFCARAWDAVGNASPLDDLDAPYCVSVLTDVTPPLAFDVFSPDGDAWQGPRPTFTWEASSDWPAGVQRYLLLIEGNDPIDAGTQISYELAPAEALADGEYSWSVQVLDALGNARMSSNSADFRVDGAPPGAVQPASPASGAWVVTKSPVVCWQAALDKGASGVQQYVLWLDGAAHTTMPATQTCAVAGPVGQGDHTWAVQAIDGAGNEGALGPSRIFRVDLTAPATPTPTAPQAGLLVGVLPMTFAWLHVSDAPAGSASGVCSYVVAVDGVSESTTGDDNSLLWMNPLVDGTHSFTVRAVDCAGNVGSPSAPRAFTVDTTPPSSLVLLFPKSGEWTTVATPTVEWTAASDATSGVCGYEVIVDGAVVELPPEQTSWAIAPALSDGPHVVAALAVDCAGNDGAAGFVDILVDTVAPSSATLNYPGPNSCADELPLFSWSACADLTSGVAMQQVRVDGDPAGGTLSPDATTAQLQFPLSVGVHEWTVECTDNAGKTSTAPPVTFANLDCDDGDLCTLDSCAFSECAHQDYCHPCESNGDVTGDQQLNIVDVQCLIVTVLWQISGTQTAPPACLFGSPIIADLNCDSTVGVVDIVLGIELQLGHDLSPVLDADGDGCVDACGEVDSATTP